MCLKCNNTGQIYDKNLDKQVDCPRCSKYLRRERDLMRDTETGREQRNMRR